MIGQTWFQEALAAVRDFVDRVGGEFQTSEVREFAEKNGVAAVSDNRIWGSVMKAARRQGVITHRGFANSVSETRNSGPMSVWTGV